VKPGPKTNAKQRHKMAALYFASCLFDDGSDLYRICELVEANYGVIVSPTQVREFAELHAKAASKINFGEFRTASDLLGY
jgi:hypothetical protein